MAGDPGAMPGAAPGWYPDAVRGDVLRWWDGRQWTNATQAMPYAPMFFPQPRKPLYRRAWFWIIVVLLTILGGCTAVLAVVGVAANHVINDKHTVVYSVTGTGTADISYFKVDSSGAGGTTSTSGVALPWTATVVGKGSFAVYSVTATLEKGTSVACSVTIDGAVKTTQTSTGTLGFVDCVASP